MVRIYIPQMGKRMNEGAFRGNLYCPVCQSRAIRFVEMVGPYRIRYRCRKCGMKFQYETGRDLTQHPYAPLRKPKWQNIVEAAKGRTKKENKS
jgi:transposase-like protein